MTKWIRESVEERPIYRRRARWSGATASLGVSLSLLFLQPFMGHPDGFGWPWVGAIPNISTDWGMKDEE